MKKSPILFALFVWSITPFSKANASLTEQYLPELFNHPAFTGLKKNLTYYFNQQKEKETPLETPALLDPSDTEKLLGRIHRSIPKDIESASEEDKNQYVQAMNALCSQKMPSLQTQATDSLQISSVSDLENIITQLAQLVEKHPQHFTFTKPSLLGNKPSERDRWAGPYKETFGSQWSPFEWVLSCAYPFLRKDLPRFWGFISDHVYTYFKPVSSGMLKDLSAFEKIHQSYDLSFEKTYQDPEVFQDIGNDRREKIISSHTPFEEMILAKQVVEDFWPAFYKTMQKIREEAEERDLVSRLQADEKIEDLLSLSSSSDE